jgi:hypothetical protein
MVGGAEIRDFPAIFCASDLYFRISALTAYGGSHLCSNIGQADKFISSLHFQDPPVHECGRGSLGILRSTRMMVLPASPARDGGKRWMR